jgi:hypothetical protein
MPLRHFPPARLLPVPIQQQADVDAVKIASIAGFDPAALGRYLARASQSEARPAALEKCNGSQSFWL